MCHRIPPVKTSDPGLFFLGQFLITAPTSLLAIGLFIIFASSWFGLGRLIFSKYLFISLRLSTSDDHHIYYCGQESLRRNGVAIMVNKRVRNAVLGCTLKNDRMISVCLQGKPFKITVIQSRPQAGTLKKMKLNGFMKTYKTF